MKPLARKDEPSSLINSLEGRGEVCSTHGIDPEHLEHALYGSAREFLARPGKAFRARLIEACHALAGGPGGGVPTAALEAIELLHGGSLIVDDIQDDAEVRRGAPALHRVIGMPLALNTGNWLYFVALSRLDELALEPQRARELTRTAHVCLMRCHEGQALDLALRVSEVRRSELGSIARAVSALKTGALAGFAAQLGGITAAAPGRILTALDSFGQKIGLALQMLDDLGSFVAEGRHHKALEDLRGQRVSWVWSWASETLDELSFKQLVRQLGRDGELELVRERLAEAVEPLGRRRIRATIDDASAHLSATFPASQALEQLRVELTRLEKSYG